MKKNLLKITALTLFAAAITGAPVWSHAADTNAPLPPAGQTPPPKHKHRESFVFHGKASGVDTSAMTLTVGERTFGITSETKITKNGQPATLGDIAVGDMVGGAYKKTAEDKLVATTVNVGRKPGEGKGKTKE
jgi:hypothetical protein